MTPTAPTEPTAPVATPLPPTPTAEERRTTLVAMLDKWLAYGVTDDADDGYNLLRALEAARPPGARTLFAHGFPAAPRLEPMTEERRAAAVALLDKWIAEDEAGAHDDEGDGYDLLAQLDANRGPNARKLFPPEMKGKTW